MKVKTEFVSNYLTQGHYKLAKESSIFVLMLCLLASLYQWYTQVDLSASYQGVFIKGEYWRLFTTSFVHANLNHLLSNSLFLSILTYFVTSFYGIFSSVVLSFSVGVVTNAIVLYSYGAKASLVGASGVVFYLWGFWMILYMFLQRHMSLSRRILTMGTVFLVLLVPTEYKANTSYFAHYLGYALGVITGLLFYFLHKTKLHRAEKWKSKIVHDELTQLDIIALSHPREE